MKNIYFHVQYSHMSIYFICVCLFADLTTKVSELQSNVSVALMNITVEGNSTLSQVFNSSPNTLDIVNQMTMKNKRTKSLLSTVSELDEQNQLLLNESIAVENETLEIIEKIVSYVNVSDELEEIVEKEMDSNNATHLLLESLLAHEQNQTGVIKKIYEEVVKSDDVLSQEILARASIAELERRQKEMRWQLKNLLRENTALKIALNSDSVSPYK